MDNGKATIIASIIAAIATLAAAVIGLYGVTLQKENSALQVQNTESQSEIIELHDRISKSEETVSSLQETISQLRTTQGQSENENSALQGQLSALQDENAKLTQELQALQDATLSDGNVALQQQISALQEENSRLKGEIEKLRGNSPLPAGESYDLLTVCPPYETRRYTAPDNTVIMGTKYKHGFYLASRYFMGQDSYAYFNLNEQYKTMEFDVGHVDASDMHSATLTIYLDGETEEPFALKPNMILTHFEIPVSGIRQVRIEIVSIDRPNSDDFSQYGFVNAKLYS